MSFRAKLLLTIVATVTVVVWLVALAVTFVLGSYFEGQEKRRTAAALGAFQRELERRRTLVEDRVERAAASEDVDRLSNELASGAADMAAYVDEAQNLARTVDVSFLDLVGPDRTIISSSYWSARFGYRHALAGNSESGIYRLETPAGAVPALLAIRQAPQSEGRLYVIGGVPIDAALLRGLTQDVQIDWYPEASRLEAVEQARRTGRLITRVDQTEFHGLRTEEIQTAIPLKTNSGELVGVALFRQTTADLALLKSYIRQIAMAVGIAGVLLGLALGSVLAGRVTKPLAELHAAVEELGRGNYDAAAPADSNDEVGQVAGAFNRMRSELLQSRAKLMQAERVAAWRELARRLAHELKNPLFPLQLTVENLRRARDATPGRIAPGEFDEIFNEGTRTLLAEVQNLKGIIAEFSDFAKMPAPDLQEVALNELLREEAGFLRAQIAPREFRLEFDHRIGNIRADPAQLKRIVRNLVLNAVDATSEGGSVAIRTARQPYGVRLEVADTGVGLTSEEKERLFTPYYTTKVHGTGLGLAIVQSIASDHGASISVDSEPGKGTAVSIEFRAGVS